MSWETRCSSQHLQQAPKWLGRAHCYHRVPSFPRDCLKGCCPSCRWRWPEQWCSSLGSCWGSSVSSQDKLVASLRSFQGWLVFSTILLFYHDKEVSGAVYWHKDKQAVLTADGRVGSCSAPVLALQRTGGVTISGEITIVGNSRGNSRADSEQTTDCQTAFNILASILPRGITLLRTR